MSPNSQFIADQATEMFHGWESNGFPPNFPYFSVLVSVLKVKWVTFDSLTYSLNISHCVIQLQWYNECPEITFTGMSDGN